MQWKEHSTACMLWPKTHNLNLIMRKHETNLNWGTFYRITGLYSSKVSRSWTSRKDLWTVIKDTKETWQLNALCDSDQYPFALIKDIIEISGKICGLDGSSTTVLISWLRLQWRISLWEKYTLKYLTVMGTGKLFSNGSRGKKSSFLYYCCHSFVR